MATLVERELILKEIGPVFGEFQDALNALHNDYRNKIGEKANSLLMPPMAEVLGDKFTEFAKIYSGFHGYLSVMKSVLEQQGDKLDFVQAIGNLKTVCVEWSAHLGAWKHRYR